MDKIDTKYGAYDANFQTRVDALNTSLKNQCLSPAGLAIGSVSKATLKIVNTVDFVFDGIIAAKTTAAVPFTATDHDITVDPVLDKEAVYLVTFSDVAGTPVVTMGDIADGAGNAVVPETPEGHVVVGMCRITALAAGTGFDATTTELDSAANVTVAYTDLSWVAPRFDEEASF